ncbi:sigma-70 family RNA polymerase sigma factor [Cohnella endophytica]|uniref:RNA polymerase sigma factor n=1 Tax=Cohnella endophytica TaxID=2419778 RepID=A0A494XI61_9BACL|nr:sigma-70 family RNA polymerase sigma factor [Cohnella endophytica]RKP47859.1 sigma-70 family RNA polymerase sigma factor [Cohnella endophytica]
MDYEYIKQMDEGIDRNALLDELMMTFGKDVWNYAFCLTRRRELAEDIAQETFIKAYNAIYSFRGGMTMKAWLLTIARNTARDYFKSAWFRRVQLVWEEYETSVFQPSAEKQWFVSLEQREVWNAVLSLPRKLRETLLLYAHHHLSHKEIAELLQLSEGTVKSRIFRARAAISRKLGKPAAFEGGKRP